MIRVCDWCEKPAPEGGQLLRVSWADYECCSMECVVLAEAEARDITPGCGHLACDGCPLCCHTHPDHVREWPNGCTCRPAMTTECACGLARTHTLQECECPIPPEVGQP
jgi:hypothetical protein